MKIAIGVAAAAVLTAGVLLGSGQASASAERFTQRTHESMPYVVSQYGDAALLHEGYRVCGWEAQGITGASDLADHIVAEMPMSRAMAIQLQILAEVHLGC